MNSKPSASSSNSPKNKVSAPPQSQTPKDKVSAPTQSQTPKDAKDKVSAPPQSRTAELALKAMYAYPVLESLTQHSHRADILNLARTSKAMHSVISTTVGAQDAKKIFKCCPPDSKLDLRCHFCKVPGCPECLLRASIEKYGELPNTVPEAPNSTKSPNKPGREAPKTQWVLRWKDQMAVGGDLDTESWFERKELVCNVCRDKIDLRWAHQTDFWPDTDNVTEMTEAFDSLLSR